MPDVVDEKWEPFTKQWTALLTTYKMDGTGIATPVNVAVEGDYAYFRSYDKAWKTKRISNNPEVAVAPATVRGKSTGPSVRARARLLAGEEDRHAAQVIGRKHPVFQRLIVRAAHKIARYRTMHYELTLVD